MVLTQGLLGPQHSLLHFHLLTCIGLNYIHSLQVIILIAQLKTDVRM